MAKQEQRDAREYYVFLNDLDIGGAAATLANIPIPVGGQIIRVYHATTTVYTVAQTNVVFELRSSDRLFTNGVQQDMFIATAGSAVGKCQVNHYSPYLARNYATEPEDAEAVAVGSVLEVVTDGGATVGRGSLLIVIKP